MINWLIPTLKKDKNLWLALAIGFIVVLGVMLPRFLDPFSTEDDFLNWYWMHRFYDPTLFPNDFVIEQSVLNVPVGPVTLWIYKTSPLYSLLFQLFSPLAPVVLLGKLLVFPLMLVSIYYLYRIGERLTSARNALIICVLFVLLNVALTSLVSVMGGFQRSFVLPLMLAFVYYWWQGYYGRSLFVLLLTGGIYPPLCLLLAITAAFELGLFWWQERGTPTGRKYRFYFAGLAAIGLIILALLWPSIEPRFVAALTNSTSNSFSLADDSRFGPHGRANLFNIYPFVGRAGIADHGTTSIIILFLALFTAVILIWQPRRLRAFPRIFKTLFWASWVAFASSWAVLVLTGSFLIYLPSRYTQSSLVLILFVFVAVHAPAAIQAAAGWITTQTSFLVWISGLIAAIMLALAVFWPQPQPAAASLGHGLSRWLLVVLAGVLLLLSIVKNRQPEKPKLRQAVSLDPRRKQLGMGLLILAGIGFIWLGRPFMDYTYFTASPAQRALYAFVQTLPKDTLLAGSPDVNSVSMYSKRQVFYSYERLGPSETAVVDALVAYYAATPEPILSFCEQYHVDYLIINQDDFTKTRAEDGRYYYEPYHSQAAVKIGASENYYLETLSWAAKSFQQSAWSVVPCTAAALNE